MKLTDEEFKGICEAVWNRYFLSPPPRDETTKHRIESILSRPEQGGEEMMRAKDVLIKNIPQSCYWVEGDALTNTPIHYVIKAIDDFAQLRTAQLRSELDEAKREIERLNERMELLSKMRE